jgi:integrase
MAKKSFSRTEAVGESLLTYLEKARPAVSCPKVFLTVKAPYGPLSGGALFNIVESRFKGTGIDVPSFGPHMLRHTFASRMLAQNESLKSADMLGHRCLDTTFQYTKIDFHLALSSCLRVAGSGLMNAKIHEFTSCLGPRMTTFCALRQATGSDYPHTCWPASTSFSLHRTSMAAT